MPVIPQFVNLADASEVLLTKSGLDCYNMIQAIKRQNTFMFLKCFISFLLIFTSMFVSGQNLVPNGSFEDFYICPDEVLIEYDSWLEYCEYWISPNAYSPDYFNSCVSVLLVNGVPDNYYGEQEAFDGNAYAGVFMPAFDNGNAREYIQVELISSLESSTLYFIEFYVSLSDDSEYAIHEVGVYFSDDQISTTTIEYINVEPQFVNDGDLNPLLNKDAWIKVSGQYIAEGGESFIIIGNFDSGEEVNIEIVDGGIEVGECLYYIDKVYIGESNPDAIEEVSEQQVYLISNIESDYLELSATNDNIKYSIIDINGRMLDSGIIGNSRIDIHFLSDGFYFLIINDENNSQLFDFIKQ